MGTALRRARDRLPAGAARPAARAGAARRAGAPAEVALSFLAPLWLAGLLALLVPIALHLLGRGRPPRVPLGSVRLLVAGAVRVPRRARLQRPLLLALRCLLLAVLVLALAGPRLRAGAAARAAPRAWLLLEPGLATARQDAALEARWLAPGLPLVDPAEAAPTLPDPAAVPGGLWSLVAEAAAAAPAGAPLRVVTSGRLATLHGERPLLGRPVTWEVVPDARSNRWPVGLTGEATALRAVVAESDRERTRQRAVEIGAGTAGAGLPAGSAAVLLDRSARSLRLAAGDVVPADDVLPLPAAAVRRVAVFAAPGRQEDAGYVTAGIRAAAAQAGLPLELAGTTTAAAAAATADPAARPHLAFWLGDGGPPPELRAAARAGATLVLDAAAPERECVGSLHVAAAAPVAWQRCAEVAVPPAAVALWRSDSGRPLLVAETFGAGRVLRLAGRFHPAWSALVLSPTFPEWLLGLLATGEEEPRAETAASDRRGDGGQGAPEFVERAGGATGPQAAGGATTGRRDPRSPARAAGAGPAAPAPPSRGPERLLWAALPALVVLERWLARRSR